MLCRLRPALRGVRPHTRRAPPRLQHRQQTTASTLPADGKPLMQRIPNRPLPPLPAQNRWMRTLPVFAVLMAVSTLAIFNYQKQNSSVVSSTMYALRTNPRARELLGEEIYFAHSIPWIQGTIDQVHGKVDIGFSVKGSRRNAWMTFVCLRENGRQGPFTTVEWSLQPDGGDKISLLDTPESATPESATPVV